MKCDVVLVTSVRVIRYDTQSFNPSFVPLAAATNQGAAAFTYKILGMGY